MDVGYNTESGVCPQRRRFFILAGAGGLLVPVARFERLFCSVARSLTQS